MHTHNSHRATHRLCPRDVRMWTGGLFRPAGDNDRDDEEVDARAQDVINATDDTKRKECLPARPIQAQEAL